MFGSAVEVLWTARYDYQPNWQLLTHKHEYFQMIYFLSGSGIFTLDDKEYYIKMGSIFLIKPWLDHGLTPFSIVRTLDVKFFVTDPALLQLLTETAERVEDKELLHAGLFEQIRREGEQGAPLYRQMCDLHLSQILIHFLRRAKEFEPKEGLGDLRGCESFTDPTTQRAVDFIKAHYFEDLDLGTIARATGKSDRCLRLRFEESLGTSPMRFLLQFRVQKSKDLISHSEFPLKEVAEMVGFKTIHHFARAFHELCGETPGEWRRKQRSSICKDICVRPDFRNTIWTVSRQSARNVFVKVEPLASLQRVGSSTD